MFYFENRFFRKIVRTQTNRQTIRLITILLSFAFSSTAQAASDLVVRWHGDYFQHRWIPGIPGGSPSEIKENRNLRGGNKLGAIQHLTLDEDGDGDNDDSRVILPFSLVDPLNPPAEHFDNPNGIFYHEDLPSARFYGGLSTSYFNHESDRFDQAFIENDGAGGAPDDIGYTPSPYIAGGSEYDQAWLDFLEAGRHPVDGRYRKTHRGPQEDFAISIYKPDAPYLEDTIEDPLADNQVAFHGAFLWKKEDFLAEGDQKRVTLDATSSFSFESTRWWSNVGAVRWIIQDADNQLYVSEFNVAGQLDNFGFVNEFVDPLSSLWARYNPADITIDFDQDDANLVWHDPVAEGLFTNILSLGLYIENDTPSGELTQFSFDEVRFEAQVVDMFDTADFNTDGFVDESDLSTLLAALGNSDTGDADGDGDTDGNDFLIWQSQFTGTGGALSSSVHISVPEPNTIMLLTVILSIFACWPRFIFPKQVGRAK